MSTKVQIPPLTLAVLGTRSPATLIYSGPFMVYFNRHTTDGRVWCVGIDRGPEIAVTKVELHGLEMWTVYEPIVKSERDHTGPPSAWFAADGEVRFIGSEAHCYPLPPTRITG